MSHPVNRSLLHGIGATDIINTGAAVNGRTKKIVDNVGKILKNPSPEVTNGLSTTSRVMSGVALGFSAVCLPFHTLEFIKTVKSLKTETFKSVINLTEFVINLIDTFETMMSSACNVVLIGLKFFPQKAADALKNVITPISTAATWMDTICGYLSWAGIAVSAIKIARTTRFIWVKHKQIGHEKDEMKRLAFWATRDVAVLNRELGTKNDQLKRIHEIAAKTIKIEGTHHDEAKKLAGEVDQVLTNRVYRKLGENIVGCAAKVFNMLSKYTMGPSPIVGCSFVATSVSLQVSNLVFKEINARNFEKKLDVLETNLNAIG